MYTASLRKNIRSKTSKASVEYTSGLEFHGSYTYSICHSLGNSIHFGRMDFATLTFRISPYPIKWLSGWFSLLPCFFVLFLLFFSRILVFNANTVDFYETTGSVASDLILYCLPMSLFGTLNHKLADKIVSYFPQKISFDISCKMSPFMKRQSKFSGRSKNFKMSAEFLSSLQLALRYLFLSHNPNLP